MVIERIIFHPNAYRDKFCGKSPAFGKLETVNSHFMKTIAHLSILIGLFGCRQGEGKLNDQTEIQDSTINNTEIVRHGIEDIVPTLNLPEGFRLDTIQKTDTARNLSIFISFPVSGMKQLDKVVFDEIEKQKNDFIRSLDLMIIEKKGRMSSINSDFQAEPVSVFKDGKVTSILYIVSYYHGGAAHPITMYYSFNFDNKTQKRISFSDYFIVKNLADTIFMTDLITKAIGREGVFVSNLKGIDFNIEQDTISFNFDDYEIASYADGIMQGRIHRQKLKNRIKGTYR